MWEQYSNQQLCCLIFFVFVSQMLDERNQLPIVESREEILHAIDVNQVVLIRGETGSGKTTQVIKL
jgi:HrpA-like RNA helicase